MALLTCYETQIYIYVSFTVYHCVKNVFTAEEYTPPLAPVPVPVLTLHVVTGLMLGIY